MKTIFGWRFCFREAGLKVVRQLKRILTIASYILMMSDESYNRLSALIGQITFNVRNFLI